MIYKKSTLLIETAKNGFLVYLNYDVSPSTLKPTPYVFETMASLLNFVKYELSSKSEKGDIIEDESEERYKY
jgi:hypothetical protein